MPAQPVDSTGFGAACRAWLFPSSAVCFVALTLLLALGARSAVGEAGHWASNGPAGTTVPALAPGEPRVLYAGTDSHGLWRSTDDGATWQATPLKNGPVRLVVVDSRHPRTIYAQLDNKLFKSTDGGDDWKLTGLDDYFVFSVAIDPVTPTRLYAGAFDAGVYRSNDGGATWEPAASGLPSLDSFDLVIDPTNPNVIYAANNNDEGSGGVFVSRDGADSWAAAGLSGVRVEKLVIDRTRPSHLLAAAGPNNEGLGDPSLGGVYATTDGGESWRETGLSDVNVTSVAIDSRTPSTLYATVVDSSGLADGVLKSTDDGITWASANAGLPNPDVFPALVVVIDPSEIDTLYVATDGAGVWKSADGGANWSSFTSGLPLTIRYPVKGLACGESLTAYAAADRRGLFRTTNGGATWEPINADLRDREVDALAVAVDPIHPATVYASTLGGVIKSPDGGSSWTLSNQGLEGTLTQSLSIDPTNSATLYALTTGGVFKTLDAGRTWSPMNQGLRFFGQLAFAIAPDAPNVLYLETSPGLFKSTDGSQTWEPLEDDLPIAALAAQDAITVFAAGATEVFGTTDGGVSWAQLLSDLFMTSVAVDLSSGAVYAAGEGVWRSNDKGATWRRIDDGLNDHFVDALALSSSDPFTIYAGTSEGVFVSGDAAGDPGSGGGCTMVPRQSIGGVTGFLMALAIPIGWAGLLPAK